MLLNVWNKMWIILLNVMDVLESKWYKLKYVDIYGKEFFLILDIFYESFFLGNFGRGCFIWKWLIVRGKDM